MSTQTFTGTLRVLHCYSCGTAFGMPESFYEDRLRDRRSFWCPAGHKQHFIGETEAERYKRQMEAANRRAAAAEGQAETARRSAAAYRGEVTKVKRRIANGVCPCCNRAFKNLARHMKSQHPEYEGLRVEKRGRRGPWYNIVNAEGDVVEKRRGLAAARDRAAEMASR